MSLSSPVGGRLSQFVREWERVTSNSWILTTVRTCYQLEFTSFPTTSQRYRPTRIPADRDRRQALLSEITQLLEKKAIEKVQSSEVVFSSIFFLTTKKSGEWRPILTLRNLNVFIKPRPFKMESLAAVLPELQKDWWGASLDLKDAYMHVHIDLSCTPLFALGRNMYHF
jgi:hypothetical protein